jgi:hypothetical protein
MCVHVSSQYRVDPDLVTALPAKPFPIALGPDVGDLDAVVGPIASVRASPKSKPSSTCSTAARPAVYCHADQGVSFEKMIRAGNGEHAADARPGF